MRCRRRKLLARLVVDLLGHVGGADRLLEFGDFRRLAFIGLAELALDRRHLLAQQHLAIARVERRLGFPADFLRQPQNLDPVRQQARDPLHSGPDIHRLEDLLLLVRRRVHEGRDHIRQRAGRIDPLHRGKQFVRRLRQEPHRFDRLASQMDKARFDLVRRWMRFRNPLGAHDEERPAAQIFDDAEPLLALADEMVRSFRRGDVAQDIGDRAHAVHVDRDGVCGLGISLHEHADRLLFPHRALRRLDRAGPAERDRQRHARKEDHPAHRHDDQRVGRQRRPGRRRAMGILAGGRSLRVSHDAPPTSGA